MSSHDSKTKSKLKKLGAFLITCLEKINLVMLYVGGLAVLYLTVFVTYDVIARYVFNKPTVWVVETSEYMLLILAFFPAAWILSQDGHVKIDLVLQWLDKRKSNLLEAISSILGLLYCLFLLYFSAERTHITFTNGDKLNTMLQPPAWPVYAVITIGALLLSAQFIIRTRNYISEARKTTGL